MSKIKIVTMLVVVFFLSNLAVYNFTHSNETNKINMVLDKSIEKLKIHYEILLNHQNISADATYKSTLLLPGFIEIFSKVKTANEEEKASLRNQLQTILTNKHKIIKPQGVLQYHLVLPNNESFLRMHKPNKFGDNLTSVRTDFRYTNRTKKIWRGFLQGRTSHGFRNVYPIFDKNNQHIGAIEISYSSSSFQDDLTNISKIHTHFLVNKEIFDAKAWETDDLIQKYAQSSEHRDYMITMTSSHTEEICIVENREKLDAIREEIDANIKRGKAFALYTEFHFNHVEVISFYPITSFNSAKPKAWLVSYYEDDFIYAILKSGWYIRIISFFVLLIILYFTYQQILSRKIIKEEHKLLDDVLNFTEDIIFATDFKKIGFSNQKFKNFLNIETDDEFNEDSSKTILDLFTPKEGYLHAGLIKDGETFIDLISQTNQENRNVSILDKFLIPKAFAINIVKTHYGFNRGYLVTLTDITKLKEKEKSISDKAFYDGLTGVYNRNKFDELVEIELKRSARYKQNLSIAIVDIDHFKDFNDTFGHLIGDEVLIMLAKTLSRNVRETDTFARWGGEEFVILFTETSLEKAKNICDKLRVDVEQMSHPMAGKITASFGVTQYIENDTLKSMFKRCDDALYEAKSSGRNRVCSK